MNAKLFASERRLVVSFFLALAALMAVSADAQIQQAWVAHYNNGITNGTNQPVKMALDANGNIYITGFSQNANAQLGYVTIKYAPNGHQLSATRYDSTSYPSATPAAMVLDVSNNVIVTGSAYTIKYDSNGNQLWAAPYAGTALAVDSNANIYVAGFSKNFGTVKITPQGAIVWSTTYVDSYGPTVSQSVLVDTASNVYVSGLDSYYGWTNHGMIYGPDVQLTTIKYSSNGNQIWKASRAPAPQFTFVQIGGAALDASNNLYLVAEWGNGAADPNNGYLTYKYASDGTFDWGNDPEDQDGNNKANALVPSSFGSILMTGVIYVPNSSNIYAPPVISYGTVELNTNGSGLWNDFYAQTPSGTSVGTSLAVDSANNCYVTGYASDTNSINDIVTIAYGPNGNQLWLQRYQGPGNGNCAGNAIAVDHNGNVYVAGYETTAAGGTEMVLIKYSSVILQRRPDGTVLLEAQGSPGESFDIRASADLQSWLDLGSAIADTNGLMQFDDTNAVNYPARFYVTFPQ